jgi:FkbM family methyltransferase
MPPSYVKPMTPPVKGVLNRKHFQCPYLEVELSGMKLRFADGGHYSRKRVDSYATKEPATLLWLDRLAFDEVLVDVGANVGMYTVYAAKRGVEVVALEPEALNYAELHKNLLLNGLGGNVRAFCLAATDPAHEGLTELYLSDFVTGYSHHDCGENRWEGPVTRLAPSKEARPVQGCVAIQLDELANVLPRVPNHLKIDVDGLEGNVLKGALQLLDAFELKTLLMEVDWARPDAADLFAFPPRRAGWHVCWPHAFALPEGRITREEWDRRTEAAAAGGPPFTANVLYHRGGLDGEAWDEYFRRATA